MKRIPFLFLFLSCFLTLTGENLAGEQILEKVEENTYAETMIYEGKLTINKGDRTFVKTFDGWSVGDEKAFVKFTNREDMGVKYLKIANELWIAEEEDVVKISGHLLKRSIMGSDFSFEDMMESNKLSELYEVNIEGEEKVMGKDCYILKLESINEEAPYAKQKLWVGKEDFIPYRFEYFALSGRLMKSAEILETEDIDGRDFPVKIKMMDELRKNSSSVFEIDSLKLGVDIPDEVFSRKNLLK